MDTIKQFQAFKPNCIICNKQNSLSVHGNIVESVGDHKIVTLLNYSDIIFRKNIATFTNLNKTTMSKEALDRESFNSKKYENLAFENNEISFDHKFPFKLRIFFRSQCKEQHYAYVSRSIILSHSSPDITKGYTIQEEFFALEGYEISSIPKLNQINVFNLKISDEPVVLPLMDLKDFNYDDPEKFVKKMQNIFLLA